MSNPTDQGMVSLPSWLPEAIAFAGDWETFVETLYGVFTSDFKDSRRPPQFRCLPVWHDRRVLGDGRGKEEGFWHLVTRDQKSYDPKTSRSEMQRVPDLDRAGRVPWVRPIIGHDAASEVLAWDCEEATKRGPTVRTYVWLKDHDFVVILEKKEQPKGAVFMLITSFEVRYEDKRRDLEGRYERRRK